MVIADKSQAEHLAELEAKIASVLRGGTISEVVAKAPGWIDYGSITVPEDQIPDAIKSTFERDTLANLSWPDMGVTSKTIKAVMPVPATVMQFNPVPGMKFDNGKLDWSLLPIESVEEIIKVLEFGATKYAKDNWKNVPDAQHRYRNALVRHVMADMKGELNDPESGLPHLSHAACCILFILYINGNTDKLPSISSNSCI